jgi:hypothetical protein
VRPRWTYCCDSRSIVRLNFVSAAEVQQKRAAAKESGSKREAALANPIRLQRLLIVADPQALTVSEMVAAMRAGLKRKANVFPLPPRSRSFFAPQAKQRSTSGCPGPWSLTRRP